MRSPGKVAVRRRLVSCVLPASAALLWQAAPVAAQPVSAQPVAGQPAFPVRPVRMINPFSGGGGIELTARQMGQHLSERWGQPVIVDNRPGA
ncbi:MAG: hypothetical protein IOD09_03815, partial [Rhodocyclaceae bacterium]|nr:hypothetical protein [Rhodocyclaceae bacterium]